jgi:hypothetical protein
MLGKVARQAPPAHQTRRLSICESHSGQVYRPIMVLMRDTVAIMLNALKILDADARTGIALVSSRIHLKSRRATLVRLARRASDCGTTP